MKKIMLPVILLVIMCSMCSAEEKSVEFKYRYNPGDIDKYKLIIDVNLNIPNMPAAAGVPSKFKMSVITRQKVLGILPDGTAKINLSYSDFNFDCPGMPPEVVKKVKQTKLPEVSVNMKVSRDGRILGVEGVGEALKGVNVPSSQLSNFMGQLGQFGVFPDWPVKVGDGWKQTIPIPFGGGDIKIVSMLDAAAVPLGKETVSKIRQTFESHIEMADLIKAVASAIPTGAGMPQDAQSALSTMTGGIDIGGWGVSYFSPSKGKLIKSNANMKASLNIGMPAQAVQQGAPAQLTMSVDMNMSVSRVQ